jgi:hypothetical protein
MARKKPPPRWETCGAHINNIMCTCVCTACAFREMACTRELNILKCTGVNLNGTKVVCRILYVLRVLCKTLHKERQFCLQNLYAKQTCCVQRQLSFNYNLVAIIYAPCIVHYLSFVFIVTISHANSAINKN